MYLCVHRYMYVYLYKLIWVYTNISYTNPGFILALPTHPFLIFNFSHTLRYLDIINYNIYTYSFNPTIHVVSWLLNLVRIYQLNCSRTFLFVFSLMVSSENVITKLFRSAPFLPPFSFRLHITWIYFLFVKTEWLVSVYIPSIHCSSLFVCLFFK